MRLFSRQPNRAAQLAAALEAEHQRAPHPHLEQMITRARQGYYDPERSPLTLPVLVLVSELVDLGRQPLAARAISGEWGGTGGER